MLTQLLECFLYRSPNPYPRGPTAVIEPPRATSPVVDSEGSDSESEVQHEHSEDSTAYSDDDADSIFTSPERTSSPVWNTTNEVELPWRGGRLSTMAVSSPALHRNSPSPQPSERREQSCIFATGMSLLDLPPELLVQIFELLIGDPTRNSAVNYRLSRLDTSTPHFSHSKNLECMSRVNRQCRALAWPLLMSTLSVVRHSDVATIARLPQRHRNHIRHLCITMGAIETLYVYICALLGLQTNRAQTLKDEASQKLRASGVVNVGVVEEDGARYVDGTFLTGLSLKRLTVFRPRSRNKAQSGESVTRGFTRFFNRSVVRLLADSASTLELLDIRDSNTKWVEPATLPADKTLSALSMPRLSHLTYMTSHAIPPLDAIQLPAFASLTCSTPEVDSGAVPTLLARNLISLRTRHPMLHYPTCLRTLHILPSIGIDQLEVIQLTRALRSLQQLQDLRLCLAKPVDGTPEPQRVVLASIIGLLESLSSTIRTLGLQETSGSMNGSSLIADAFISSIHRPEASAAERKTSHTSLVVPLLHLKELEILSLVLHEERQDASCQTKPNLRAHEGPPVDTQWTHAGHMNCAEFLINRLPSLREVHFPCVTDSVGSTCGMLVSEQTVARYRTRECVWGRPIREPERGVVTGTGDGEEVEHVVPRWMDTRTKTQLWERAMY